MALHFEERGNKKASTIVFIHGGGVSSWIWKKQMEYFKDFHCIAVDLPRHGKGINEGEFSIKDCAYRIAELIETHANGGKAHLVGHSLGAKVAVELLSIRPEVAMSAVIASALFRPIPLMKLSHKHFFYRLTTYLSKYKWIEDLSLKQYNFPDQSFADNFIMETQRYTASMLYNIYDEFYKSLSLPEGLEKVNVPTLIIAGEKEPKAMRQSVIDMVKIMPEAKGIVIKNGTHIYPWAMYEVFNRIVEKWINDKDIENEFIVRCETCI